jgi:hypothetical protein
MEMLVIALALMNYTVRTDAENYPSTYYENADR